MTVHVWQAQLFFPRLVPQALKQLKKKWISYLNKLTAITRSKLNKIERNKVGSLAMKTAQPKPDDADADFPDLHHWTDVCIPALYVGTSILPQ